MQTRIESGEIEQTDAENACQTLLRSVVPQAEGVAVDLGTAQREHFLRAAGTPAC